MEPKPESSFNASASERRWVGRSLARAGVHLGQVVTGALASSLDALEERLNSVPKSSGAAQGRMRDLLNQDRALLAVQDNTARIERTDREADPEAPRPSVRNVVKSGGAARGRMRELLQRDRVMLSKDDDDDEDTAELKRAAGVRAADVIEPRAAEPALDCAAPECAAVQIVEVVVAPAPLTAAEAPAPAAPSPAPAPAAELARAQPLSAAALSSLPAAASMPAVPPPSAAPRSAAAVLDLDGNAPIRTRTMAKLLALQGHRDRALDIYAELIAADPNDAGLAAEAERLRK